jgi:hypothetical protein
MTPVGIVETFKCRWCNYKVPKWRTTADGKRISGWIRLQDHVMDKHEDQISGFSQHGEIDLVGEA